MPWSPPQWEEIATSAEIGAYQDDLDVVGDEERPRSEEPREAE